MTYNEITMFRRFLSDKGTFNNFEYFYNNHRLNKKVTFDKYLEMVQAEDVILNAFDMSAGINTIFNFQYWKRLDEKWQQKLSEYRKTGKITIAEEKVLCPHCNRMMPKSSFVYNSKGQLHKHCKECESGEWDRKRREAEKEAREERLMLQTEKEIADRELNLDKTTKVCSLCGKRKLRSEFYESATSPDGLQGMCKKCQDELEALSEKADAALDAAETNSNISNQETKMDDFIFFDFDKKSTKNSIGDHQFVINNKKGNYSIVINMEDSKKIIAADLLRLRLRKDNITGAMHLVFNADNGAQARAKSERCVTISNKDMVQFLVKTLGYRTTDERILVDISDNLSRAKGYITFLITKTKK